MSTSDSDTQDLEYEKYSKIFSDFVSTHKIALFIKGTKAFPQCGFSATVVEILEHYKVEFEDFNVSKDPEVKQHLKRFSDWPTFPQLYINKELIGGYDIIKELHESDELKDILPPQS